MSLQRQTYLVLGLLVEAGLLLAVLVSTWWLLLPAFVGLGMLTAGAVGVCTMTRVLSLLPGNERHSGDITAAP
jgi:hypothetical protein